MFSGPSQSSTLISEAFILGLKRPFPYKRIKGSCPTEFLNQSCNTQPKTVMACFGSQDPKYLKATWQPCSQKDMEKTMSMLDSSGVGFTKENFANGKILLDMHNKSSSSGGYPVFVAHRLPQHTFPMEEIFYKQIWDGLHEAPVEKLGQLPFGEHLLSLRSYVASRLQKEKEGKNRSWHVPNCLAHYVHFFHLFMVALNHGIPHVQIEALLLAPTVTDIMDTLKVSGICAGELEIANGNDLCTYVAETIFHERQKKTHMHLDANALTPGSDLSSDIYRRREQRFLKETTCHDALQDTIAYCGKHIPGCHSVNEAYGYNGTNAWLFDNDSSGW